MAIRMEKIKMKSDYEKLSLKEMINELFEFTSAEIGVFKSDNKKQGYKAYISFYNEDDEERLSFYHTLFSGYSDTDGGMVEAKIEAKNPLSTIIRYLLDDDSLKGWYKFSLEDLNKELSLKEDTIKVIAFADGNYTNYSFEVVDDE